MYTHMILFMECMMHVCTTKTHTHTYYLEFANYVQTWSGSWSVWAMYAGTVRGIDQSEECGLLVKGAGGE